MIRVVKGFQMTCHSCECIMDTEDNRDYYGGLFLELELLEETAKREGWIEAESDRHYCPDCKYIYEDKDKLILTNASEGPYSNYIMYVEKDMNAFYRSEDELFVYVEKFDAFIRAKLQGWLDKHLNTGGTWDDFVKMYQFPPK